MKLRILVGTVGGTAEGVAQAIEMDCGDLVNSIRVEMMDGLDIDDLDANSLFLICTSTYGSGADPAQRRDAVLRFDGHQTPLSGRCPLRRARVG